MTSALQQAFAKAAELPLDRQDTIAAIVMEEIADEERWQQSYARSQDALSKLAAAVRKEDAEGRTQSSSFWTSLDRQECLSS
jgi:hypothetical protein